jgi:hypothetical protein
MSRDNLVNIVTGLGLDKSAWFPETVTFFLHYSIAYTIITLYVYVPPVCLRTNCLIFAKFG